MQRVPLLQRLRAQRPATTHDKLEVTVLETAHAPLAASEPATPDLGSVFTSAEAPGQEAAQGKDSCKHEESAAEAEGALTPDAARAAAAAEAARQLLGSRLARVRKTGRTLPSDMKAPRGRQVNAELASFFGVGTQQQAGQDSASPAKPAAKEEPLEVGHYSGDILQVDVSLSLQEVCMFFGHLLRASSKLWPILAGWPGGAQADRAAGRQHVCGQRLRRRAQRCRRLQVRRRARPLRGGGKAAPTLGVQVLHA